ncbi:type II toxin-antitoxin system Phd/YefM family antitoxin [Clostridium estertheticum]|uniref:Antitoxin n=1 Tax=Clostridium estertheticum subsp. estertheticum TaxID=1552 RepID=A0A1J0GD18_9CLOT|nr:type II toxin-antitoxin system prevent-host-death family antitoxin [Clostridium estertheticum]APC39250.1 prevent-host-death protein [Clostridium estertheticum subsp. estertheticum]MBU3071904.1 type II toxin-antitoxin system Phd/YefM family antitoxin [Clostridium estertheticum]MBU3161996.1 type II toxin-antitoxin system Phd/YefM family antitoxin [Clostridium estertheticum]MBU3171169.1 type II toxin-antitoxin system Phd/YefM family antitoxin [Clostridium estertheticum]MBU3183276.1 type II tox
MLLNSQKMVSISEANQNFSKIAKLVDEDKSVVIMKNNKPKYILLDFDEFSKVSISEEEKLETIADRILFENLDAFKELAK